MYPFVTLPNAQRCLSRFQSWCGQNDATLPFECLLLSLSVVIHRGVTFVSKRMILIVVLCSHFSHVFEIINLVLAPRQSYESRNDNTHTHCLPNDSTFPLPQSKFHEEYVHSREKNNPNACAALSGNLPPVVNFLVRITKKMPGKK